MSKFALRVPVISTVGIAALGLLLATRPAAAVVINFDNLGNGVVVTNQYPEATFSSDPGEVVLTSAQVPPYQTSAPNFICTGTSSIDCTHDVFVKFTNPVNNLTFNSTGADNTGPAQANVDVFVGNTLVGSVPIPGIGSVHTAQFIDLSAFHNVTSIEIDKVIDPAGLAYDDFTFTVAGGVPELATWAMMLLGFGLVGVQLRRRNDAAAV